MKSAAGFLKLEPIIKLAVLCEDVAEEARILKGPASESFIDWLLLAIVMISLKNIEEMWKKMRSILRFLILRLLLKFLLCWRKE